MATHIVTLKDNNDEISYPITPVDAVFVDSNTTLADALDDKVETDLSNLGSGAISAGKIDLASLLPTIFQVGRMAAVGYTTISTAWSPTDLGTATTLSGLDPNGSYTVVGSTVYTEGPGGEYRLVATGNNTVLWTAYNADDNLIGLSYVLRNCQPTAQGVITLQRKYSGVAGQVRCGQLDYILIRTA